MLQGITPDDAMKVLDTISATDPACGGCLKSIAVAALADPSVLMACANSDAKSQLQAVLGGARARAARVCARARTWRGVQAEVGLAQPAAC